MNTEQTLKKMFADAGLDPFDAFLSDPVDWPANIREWYEAQPKAEATQILPSHPTEWEARTGREGAE